MSDTTAGRDDSASYTLYGFDISYFTGKMQAYLRYKGIRHDLVEPDWGTMTREILPRSGRMEVPVVRTADDLWLADTTPMIDWLEIRHPQGAVLPDNPYQAFFCRLIEDYADEWMWRPAMHYRWSHRADAMLLSRRFANEFLRDIPLPRRVVALYARARQRKVYVRGDGIDRGTRAHVENLYLDTLDRLQAILEKQPFLLGQRPSLADFGFFGSMFRHFSLDPTPSRIMRDRAPAVYEWVARLWNAHHQDFDVAWPEPDTIPEGWSPILNDIGAAYLPYLNANATAWARGEARFDFEISGVRYRDLPVVRYRVWCRERLQAHFDAVPKDYKGLVLRTLSRHGCWESLWRDATIASGMHTAGDAAVCAPQPVSALQRLRAYWLGGSWHRQF